jgi:NadR type nicotinamide-nucleotide adenylyltransferase
MKRQLKIAVTGPESTGKSTLVQKLAAHYHAVYVPEYCRAYLEKKARSWIFEDVPVIAQGQIAAEDEVVATNSGMIFFDTELIAIKVWLALYGRECPDWIVAEIKQRKYDLVLLMDIDLPWIADDQRSNPDDREELFSLFKQNMAEFGIAYYIIKGQGETRTQNAIALVDALVANN